MGKGMGRRKGRRKSKWSRREKRKGKGRSKRKLRELGFIVRHRSMNIVPGCTSCCFC
jgi:hypothetical protein